MPQEPYTPKPSAKRINYAGRTVGSLYVEADAGTRRFATGGSCPIWRTVCLTCGNRAETVSALLHRVLKDGTGGCRRCAVRKRVARMRGSPKLLAHQTRKGERNARIAAARAAGRTCADIGREFGICPQRVDQICKRIQQQQGGSHGRQG